VNVDAAEGELGVSVLNEIRETLLQSDSVKGNKTLLPVKWLGAKDLSALAGRPVRFQFNLRNARLYSFWVSPDQSGASRGYVAAGGPGFMGPTDAPGPAR